jgi:hypothetical protein
MYWEIRCCSLVGNANVRSDLLSEGWREDRHSMAVRNTALQRAKIWNFADVKSYVLNLPFKWVQCRSEAYYCDSTQAGMSGVRTPVGAKDLSFFFILDQASPGAYPASCTGALAEGRAARVWCWPPTPSGTEVKDEWSHMSTPLLHLVCHIMRWHLPLPFKICKWSWEH